MAPTCDPTSNKPGALTKGFCGLLLLPTGNDAITTTLPSQAGRYLSVGVGHHGQAYRKQSLVRFSSSSKIRASTRTTCQRDEDISNGGGSQAICEGDAFRKKQDHRGHISERSSASSSYHLGFRAPSLDLGIVTEQPAAMGLRQAGRRRSA